MYRLWGLLALSAFGVVAVAQDSVPSDAELRTAYCIPVVQGAISLLNEAIAVTNAGSENAPTPELRQSAATANGEARRDLAKEQTTLNRLQLYLVPRMAHRDPVALAAAEKRGEADWQELQTMAGHCTDKCGRVAPDQTKTCTDSCTDKDLVGRVQACRNPTWLPF